jgi:hypothetical protein
VHADKADAQAHAAITGRPQPGQQGQQRRLAGPRRPAQAHDGARVDAPVGEAQRHGTRAPGVGQAFEFDER